GGLGRGGDRAGQPGGPSADGGDRAPHEPQGRESRDPGLRAGQRAEREAVQRQAAPAAASAAPPAQQQSAAAAPPATAAAAAAVPTSTTAAAVPGFGLR